MKENPTNKTSQFTNWLIGQVKRMRDVRVLGLNVFMVIALIVTWSGVGVIQTNYKLQQQISRLEQENNVQKLENDNLKLRNEYFNTDEYLELAARKQFGKAAPGEKLLIVPQEVALNYTVELPEKEAEPTKITKPSYQKNFEAWMEFLFRRNANS